MEFEEIIEAFKQAKEDWDMDYQPDRELVNYDTSHGLCAYFMSVGYDKLHVKLLRGLWQDHRIITDCMDSRYDFPFTGKHKYGRQYRRKAIRKVLYMLGQIQALKKMENE